jgi:hypothetical protein
MPDPTPIPAFRLWFQTHLPDFAALTDPDEPFWDVALAHLKKLDPHLWFELSGPSDDPRELIITAGGHIPLFPFVEQLVAAAPPLPRWRFIPLKPPMGFDFIHSYEGLRFDPKAMTFLPLRSPSHPGAIAIRVGVPGFRSDIQRQARNAVAVILDTALGERSAATDIHHVEVAAPPDDAASAGYLPLPDLPHYLKQHSARTSERE